MSTKKLRKKIIEKTDAVECKICGKEFQLISGKHLSVHGFTRQEYMEEYGLTADELLTQSFRIREHNTSKFVPRNKSEVLAKIKDLHEGGSDLDGGVWVHKDAALYRQASWIFGSWQNALRAAGISPLEECSRIIWTPEDILTLIKDRHKKGLRINGEDFNFEFMAARKFAIQHFGSWDNALIAGEVPIPPAQTKWSKEKVIQEILRIKTSDKIDSVKGSLKDAANLYFGSLGKAVIASGLDPDAFFGKRFWNGEKILVELRKHYEKNRSLSSKVLSEEDLGLYTAIIRHFRSFDKALAAAKINNRVSEPSRRKPVA